MGAKKTAKPAAKTKGTSDKDQPYVSNYPPLKAWLDKHEARCNWQIPFGDPNRPTAYIESWFIGANEIIVKVYADQHGWNLYTPETTGKIAETLADAEQRLGLTPETREDKVTALARDWMAGYGSQPADEWMADMRQRAKALKPAVCGSLAECIVSTIMIEAS